METKHVRALLNVLWDSALVVCMSGIENNHLHVFIEATSKS